MTIYDIAKLAGVSPATVSKVLNNRHGVNADTVVKIQQLLTETGFRPRWQAGSYKTVGIIFPPYAGALLDSYDSVILSRCCDELMKFDYSLELLCHNRIVRNTSKHKLLGTDSMLAGVIAITAPPNYSFCQRLLDDSPAFPCVVIGKLANTEARSIPERGNHLWSNDFTAGYQLVTLFLRRNHRRFLLVCASQHDVGHSHRLEGMCSALHDGGIPKEDIMIQEVKEYLRISGNQIAMNLACKKDKPDAIIFTNGAICCGFISGCVNMNLRIPEEFSVASFEDSTELEQLPIPVTAMHTPAEQLGLAAAKNLLMQINHQKLPPPQIIQHQLKLRNTIAQR